MSATARTSAANPAAAVAAPTAAVVVEQYADVHAFAALAVPLLLQDVLRNTLCLTHLASIQQRSDTSTAGRTLALMSCDCCNLHAVLVSGDKRGMGYSPCYLSVGCQCRHLAAQLASALEQQLTLFDKITLTAAAAELLLGAQCPAHRWQLDHTLQLMVYEAVRASTAPSSSQHAGAAQLPASPAPEQQQHDLRLQQCSIHADTSLVVSWTADFLSDVFGLPDRPSHEQVQDSVLPRLQQGLFFLLRHNQPASSGGEVDSSSSGGEADGSSSSGGIPVCLASHTPSSGSSTRVTMVYTPPEQRGRGHAKTAVRQLLDKLQGDLGYSSVCLFADMHKPHIGAMYKGLGFKDADELHTLKRPMGSSEPATSEEQAALN